MTFSGARRTEKEPVFVARHKGRAGEIEHETPIHLRIEVKVEVVERFVRVAKSSLLYSALEQAIASTIQLVGDEAGEEVDGRHGFGLRLVQASFQNRSHPS
jgi:hypothetical protein